MKKNNSTIYIALTICLCTLSITFHGCRKFIEVDPPVTSVTDGNVYDNDGTAIAAVIGIYSSMSGERFSGFLSLYPELSADNMTLLNPGAPENSYYLNNLRPSDQDGLPRPWFILYSQIYKANAAIQGLSNSQKLTSNVKQNLLGQAYFLRGFFYFYLTNFYGDIPLALTTDYTVNNALAKKSSAEVYSQIIADLRKSQELLPKEYLTGDMIRTFPSAEAQRVTPNYFAATALLARVYLYQRRWNEAEAAATEVINATSLYTSTISLNQVFLKNSKETIWALQPITANDNTSDAELFTLRPGDPSPTSIASYYLSDDFMKTFEVGDQRKNFWISFISTSGKDYPYPAKYKALFGSGFTEQSILLRLGEQYLIRAESRIELGNVSSGISDINALRDRAIDKNEQDDTKRLKLLSLSLSKEQAQTALKHEKRIEFFSEVSHRWFDLKRSGEIDAVMTPATAKKGGTWSSYKSLYPIPVTEIQNNSKLTQNSGYSN